MSVPVKAVSAPIEYVKFGEGASKHFSFNKHVTIALTAGAAVGFMWKTWHWNEKRFIAQYYADLAKKEATEEAARKAAIQEKFKQLEAELLA
mmetsp:Transcript_17955/g.32788  ORF Transcript_17955/g.32788 Transcript_17955/m.32788 type:complete len:92 (+) Transcript_17955:70-345(+)|eukprot:CAMPEP_0175078778 /NCGR_PEP_ID=MMETSP0052_2-20121109/24364_1 /TAXON_ID=51329 ORGANISM="Polytomella parva, Strain SAG 63-3" /NCGR_SAMPLE_ID=MMETSP0052_2 /ASSEMBLY_ACC=CAM_ASM_000194 /LENGTH=91 /DNA_ID=CAMNT_0016348851 /DNA_START=22 /DNA_END=297 /DNA_ORIENTATION=-